MSDEVFEFRRQSRRPRNYLALGLVLLVIYAGYEVGCGFVAAILLGPALAFILARLVLNDAEGFRLNRQRLEFYSADERVSLDWASVTGVTVGNGPGGQTTCEVRTGDGLHHALPATAGFAPDVLVHEFRVRGIPVWRTRAPDGRHDPQQAG